MSVPSEKNAANISAAKTNTFIPFLNIAFFSLFINISEDRELTNRPTL
jgi:hypothetical protein